MPVFAVTGRSSWCTNMSCSPFLVAALGAMSEYLHCSFPTGLCTRADEPAQGDISSKAAAYVAFGLIRIASAFCVTKEYGIQDKPRRRDLGMQAFV